LIRALAICALAAGALGCDPCSGAPGACIALTVDGPGGASIDRLEVTITDPAGEHHGTQTGTSHSLPLHTLLELADGISGNLTVEVQGFAGTDEVGSGTTQVSLGPRGHVSAEVQLGSPIANTDGGGPDLVDCPTGAIFCDNCEYGLNLPWMGTFTDGGTDSTEVAKAHSGSTAFQFMATGVPGGGEAYFTDMFGTTYDTGMVAARFFLDPYMPIPDKTAILQFSDFVQIARDGATWTIAWQNGSNPTNLLFPSQPAFVCVEVDVDLDNKVISLYSDNNGPAMATPTSLDGIGSLSLGLIDVPQGTTAWIYVDDIVIDTKHIGCN
jgi:hypothetical protein